MKMNRFTVKISGLVLALSFLFVISACSDIDSGEAPGNGTYLVLAPNGVSFDARSVEPDTNYMMANFKDITLTATKSGGTMKTLASSVGSLEALYAKQFLLEGGAGTYSFELKGSLDNVYFSQLLENIEIEESKTNTISFTLSPTGSKDVSDFGDNGGLSVDLKFSTTNVKSIYVTLLNLATNQIKEERTISSSYFTSSGYTYKKNASYPNYYTDLYTAGSIDPGTYRLTFDFLTDNKLLINSFSYIVHVVKGLNSIVTQEIDLNQVYSISYTKNGGSLAEGEMEIAKYTRLNEVILPRLTKSNNTFIGWYDNSSFEGEPVTKIEKGSTENKTFYARFVSSVLYVNATSGDDSHDGSSGSSTKALQTLGAALNKMALTADGKKLDYTIYLTGTFTGEQTIADISATETLPASSITLAGYSGVDSDGVPKDVLDGGGSPGNDGYNSLTILTEVPVRIKNLKITNGGTNLVVGGGESGSPVNADVTLGENTLITGTVSDRDGYPNGHGVLVSSGKFTLAGGSIKGNDGNAGGGVKVEAGKFIMTGGEISGNFSVSYGGGVYIAAGAEFTMTGGSLSENYVADGDFGGAVYVEAESSVFKLGASPVIPAGDENKNNIYLCDGAKISIAESLSEDFAALITPENYTSGTQVLALADGLTDTSILASASEKIAVVPQGDAPWAIDSNGYLKELVTCAKIDATNCYSLAELVSKIEAADSATTVIFYNTLTASDIGKAGTSGTILHAIKNNSNSDATFEISVDSTDGKIALDADSSSMFYECSKITSLDMSGFDTSAVTDMSYMFYGCSGLTTIYAASDANWYAEDRSSSYMFSGCTSLTGYSEYNVDSQYAHVGTVDGKSGYFTAKN